MLKKLEQVNATAKIMLNGTKRDYTSDDLSKDWVRAHGAQGCQCRSQLPCQRLLPFGAYVAQ